MCLALLLELELLRALEALLLPWGQVALLHHLRLQLWLHLLHLLGRASHIVRLASTWR